MNKDESLALFAQGRKAWNVWANGMLAQRAQMESAGQWSEGNNATKAWIATAAAVFSSNYFNSGADFAGFVFPYTVRFDKATFSGNAKFDEAAFSGDAVFLEATFSGVARFINATFSGDASFSNAKFSDIAWFSEATFSGGASFDKATFSGEAWFDEVKFSRHTSFNEAKLSGDAVFRMATFSGIAWFFGVTFSGKAWFDEATFSSDAWFNKVVFGGYTNITSTRFEKDAAFVAINGESFFSLQKATFLQVPDFEQAHFAEAPRLDDSEFPTYQLSGAGSDASARWRALKRLAVQAHDHEREQIFFAEEIKALRGARDRPWPSLDLFIAGKPVWPGGGRYWGGLFYQVFSDFGRSMARPLMGWAGAVFGFTFYYLSRHFADHIPAYPTGMLDWAWGAHSKLTCIAGQGEPLASAIYLAIHKGSIFAGLGGSEKLTQAYACLYGEYGGDRHIPIIPDAVVYAGLGQTVFSAVMIFLFLLAVRNHFRIK